MSRIKSKVIRSTIQNKDVLEMFHGVLGTNGAVNLSIAYPKYGRIMQHAGRFITLLEAVRDSEALYRLDSERDHLARYIEKMKVQFAESFSAPDLDPWITGKVNNTPLASNTDTTDEKPSAPAGSTAPLTMESLMETMHYDKVPEDMAKKFADAFNHVKSCNVVNTIIVTCRNLVDYKKSLADPTALRDKFLLKPPMSFSPIQGLAEFNVKHIYINGNLRSEDKKFVLFALHKMYAISHDVYDAVSAPDVDVSEFSEIIMSSIGDVKKHIPRCDDAFKKILESVDLLKGNFGGYYKDYVASNNPTIIMENFVLDVAKDTKSSPQVTAQFRRIITHYRKLASEQASHPKLQSLFQQVDKNFQELEKKDRAADEGSDSDSDEKEAEDNAPAPATDVPSEPAKNAKTAKKNKRNRLKRKTKAAGGAPASSVATASADSAARTSPMDAGLAADPDVATAD